MKKYKLIINGEKYEAKILSYKGNEAKVNVNGIDYIIEVEQENIHLAPPVIKTSKSYLNPEKVSSSGSKTKSGQLIAPIPGVVIEVHKKAGDNVEAGDVLITLEAMKMESELVSPVSGKIQEINVEKGNTVLEGDLLIVITGFETKETAKNRISKTKKKQDAPVTKPEARFDGTIKAPIPGTVVDVLVKEGERVEIGEVVIILEAMKMESEIHTEKGGIVKSIKVNKGASVNEGDVLILIED